MNLLKDQIVKKYDKNGNVVKEIICPLEFGTPEKSVQYLLQGEYHDKNGIEVGQRSYQKFPRISLAFEGMTYDADRVTGSNDTREWLAESFALSGTDSQSIVTDLSPSPWSFNYSIKIRTDGIDYLCQLLENILVYWNPIRAIRVKEFSGMNIERELITRITGVSPTITTEIAESEVKQSAVDINLEVAGFLYRPISSAKVIKLVNSRYYTNGDINSL
jgi:hypothetical protein